MPLKKSCFIITLPKFDYDNNWSLIGLVTYSIIYGLNHKFTRLMVWKM
jgi:hypothetical protein